MSSTSVAMPSSLRQPMPCLVKCRTVELVESWARAAGFSNVGSQLEDVGLFAVTTARKL
jgi:hypothetical protein